MSTLATGLVLGVALTAPQPLLDWSGGLGQRGELGAAGLRGSATAVLPCETPAGPGLRFDGATSQVDAEQSREIAFDSSESFAVSFGFRSEQREFATLVMTKDRPGGVVSYSFVLGRGAGRLSFELWSWGRAKLLSRHPLNDGRWHEVVGAYDATSGEAALIVDGVLESLSPVGTGGPESVQLRLGNNLDTHQPYRGELAGFRIDGEVPPEVARLMADARARRILSPEEARESYAAYFERLAEPRPWRATERAAWEDRRAQIREQVLDDLGLWPLPERCDLALRRGGKLEREGYTVERIYWQSWPGYWAAGWLYMPTEATFPAPAVLNPHGHWENGNRHPIVQSRLITLARQGYVCLAPDSVHFTDWFAGVCAQSVMTWNNMRGLDLLASMPEVDATRIGCTGCSGGAQQTFYLMATEDRIAAAAPVCMVSKFRTILAPDGVHCDCNHVPGIAADVDTPEMAARQAPNPALIITVTGDWTAGYPTEDHPDVLATYELFGAGERVRSSHYVSGHDYSQPMREEVYGFFSQWLDHPAGPLGTLERELVPETLETLASLDAPPAESGGTDAIVREYLARRRPATGGLESAEAVAAHGERVRAGLLRVLRLPEAPPEPVVEPRGAAEEGWEKLWVRSEPEIPVPVLWRPPAADGGHTVVVVHEGGREAALAEPEVRAALEAGAGVALVDPRWFGEWSDGLTWSAARESALLNGIILGQPPASCGTRDVLAAVRFAEGRGGGPVELLSYGATGVLALLAACLDERVVSVAAHRLGASYAGGRTVPVAPHLATVGDLPSLAAALAPRALYLTGVTDPDAYALTRAAYASAGGRLEITH